MTDTSAVIAVYADHTAAEAAVKELQKSGFDMKKLSVVGKDLSHRRGQVVGYTNIEINRSDRSCSRTCRTSGDSLNAS